MSRNYELMREMEQKQAFLSNYSIEPAFTAGKCSGGGFPRQLASDLIAGLVQRVFLRPEEKPPRMVVIAAIDHGNGCSLIAASVAGLSARRRPGRYAWWRRTFVPLRCPGC